MDRPAPGSPALRALLAVMSSLHEPWSVERVARAVGVSRRTLYRAVQREVGASPMSLLRRARLLQARSALTAPHPGATVTTIALDCGFMHLGRFSQHYKRQFGELPSETLRRAVSGRDPARAV